MASRTLPTIFENSGKIHTEVQQTAKGVILTQTSKNPATVAALQAHAGEVTDFVQEGMVALMRSRMGGGMGMMRQGGMMTGGAPMMMQMPNFMMQGDGSPNGLRRDTALCDKRSNLFTTRAG